MGAQGANGPTRRFPAVAFPSPEAYARLWVNDHLQHPRCTTGWAPRNGVGQSGVVGRGHVPLLSNSDLQTFKRHPDQCASGFAQRARHATGRSAPLWIPLPPRALDPAGMSMAQPGGGNQSSFGPGPPAVVTRP